MTRRLIDFTEDSSLRQTIPPALSFSYIRALVDQHLGADAAAMLSEPQVVPREGRHQWLADAAIDSSLVRLDQASPDQAAAARRRLDEVRLRARTIWENLNSGNEQNRQQAVAILRAFEVPNDDEYVWLVGEQPLLVGWGHERVNVVPLEPAALALTYSRPLAEADPATALTESERALPTLQWAPHLEAAQPATLSSSWLATCLWALFVALALAVGGLLLPACSIHLPGTEWRLSWPAGCVAHAQNPLAELVAQNRALEQALRAQQIALQSRDFCPAPRSQSASPGPDVPSLPPNVDVKAPVQVRLDWDSNDDLDLVVKCPSGGWISPLRQHLWDESCGDGRRDLDANYKMRKRDYPTTEHIGWHDLRPGNYRVIVWPANTGSGNPIPFRIALTLFGQTRTCSGEVIWDNTKREGYVAYVIDFDPTRPVPSCNVSPTAEGHLEACTTECGKD
jgi:hypothetical protein